MEAGSWSITDETRIGRVLLRVGSLERTVPFYTDLIGLEATRVGDRVELGSQPESLLVLEEDASAPARSPREAGLFHVAIRVPTRAALGDVLARVRNGGGSVRGASDHLVSEALYLTDPEGNGVEVYRDRPRSEWPRTESGGVEMDTLPLDLASLENEASQGGSGVPAETDIGHIHLEVIDIEESAAWYQDRLGLSVMARYGSDAVFLAAGGYHHHVGLNTWNHRSEPAGGNQGLGWFELLVPSRDVQAKVLGEDPSDDLEIRDPNGIRIRVAVPD